MRGSRSSRQSAEAGVDDASRPINVGIGVHAGETVETAEGFVGSVINIAADLQPRPRPASSWSATRSDR